MNDYNNISEWLIYIRINRSIAYNYMGGKKYVESLYKVR